MKIGVLGAEPQLTILVHGYNNSAAKALKSYHEQYAVLRTQFGLSQELEGLIWFLWPGDRFYNRPMSMFAYFTEISVATEAGDLLADYLRDNVQTFGELPADVRFVGHSLGCRVVLETLRSLRTRPHPTFVVSDVILMAAAVPVEYCEPRQRLGSPVGEREVVLYSPNDRALGLAFRTGQTAAGEGFMPEAVGRRGKPENRWYKEWDTRLKHGDYWKRQYSVEFTAALFGWQAERAPRSRTPATADLPERTLPSHRQQSRRA